MKTVKIYLLATRELLNTPKSWTQGAYARDKRGASVGSHHPQAISWCLSGATYKIGAPYITQDSIRRSIGPHGIAKFNDHPDRTHQDILNLLDKAIEAQDG
jgi:hypothetical protein